MRKTTRIITLIALLCIGLFIGYLWNDYAENTETSIIEPIEEIEKENILNTGNTTGEDSLTESGANIDDDDEGDEEDAELTGEDTVAYEPLLVNDNETDSSIDDYPTFDEDFIPTLEKESGSAPHIIRTNPTTEPLTEWFKMTGKVSEDVERIDVIRDGDMTPFTLQKFTPGTTEFQYNMNPEYDNLNDGTNYYLIRAYAKDNLYQKIIEVEYQSAPSADQLDDAFKS